LLGMSQNRLSEIENGQGSFSAEQFLVILKKFNVALDYFAVAGETGEADLQNALARLGADQAGETRESLPSERLANVSDVAREIMISAEYPRLIPMLASVIVWGRYADYGVLNKIHGDLKKAGLGNRFCWFLEHTREALKRIPRRSLSGQQIGIFDRALALLNAYLNPDFLSPSIAGPEDTFEVGAVSEETLSELRRNSSSISKKWRIITRIQPEDFNMALRELIEKH
jgi:transcriptional regulator with XRE-family HTH domain